MMENVTDSNSLPHLDESLLIIGKEQNLKNNYISLRELPNCIMCKINENSCIISDSVAVANAFDKYLKIARNVDGTVGTGVIRELDTVLIKNIDSVQWKASTGTVDLTYREKTLDPIEGLFQNWKTLEENSNTRSVGNQARVTVDDFLIKQVESVKKVDDVLHDGNEIDIEKKQMSRNCEMPSEIEGEEKSTNFKSKRRAVERPYVCPDCKMAFKRNLHLKRHFIVTHTVSKNFKCDICSKSFSRKDYLNKHMSGHRKKNFKLKLLQQGIVVRTKIFSKSDK